jgi:hypothetical protein
MFSVLSLLNLDRYIFTKIMSQMCNQATVVGTWQRITTFAIVNGEQVEVLWSVVSIE